VKIAIVNLTSGGLSGGYLKYLVNLVPLLRQDPRVTKLDVFVPEGVLLPAHCGSLRMWPKRDGAAGFPTLRGTLASLAPDVVFFPTARLVDCGAIPTVVMVRNMEPLLVPFGGNGWRESLRNLARARVAHRACDRASRVIAVSDYVRRFIVERWRLPSAKIGRVYHGVAAEPAAAAAPASLQQVGRFVFTAGSIRPARGLEDLIRATPALLRAHPDLAVVIGGKADAVSHDYEARMQHLAARQGVARAIVWTGQLSSAEMAWAYGRCAAFVVTSRAEACPNVALEALSHGAPVVSTSQDPMPEFFGGTATYYRPEHADELALRVTQIMAEPEPAAAARRESARARAAEFPWRRTADETVTELDLAAKREPRTEDRKPRTENRKP